MIGTPRMRLSEKTKAHRADELADKLSTAGLRVTQARLALAHLLFGQGNRHVTADALREEALAAGLKISQATVYNLSLIHI